MALPLVLIVDDEPKLLLLVEQLLTNNAMRAAAAQGGAAGLEAIKKEKPDLILLDLAMPGMDGFQFLDALKLTAAAKAPVIVVSGKETFEDVEKAFAKGAIDYVRKPYEDARLLLKIRKHLGKNAAT